jgi:proteasome lid subunit RPN8/RPN11
MGWFSKKYDPEPIEEQSFDIQSRSSKAKSSNNKRRVWGIKKTMIDFIIEASKDSYPNEFYAKLLQKKGVIAEFSIIKTIQGRTHAIPFTYMEPPDIFLETAGTVHSHPSGDNRPSKADLEFFSKFGDTHIIIGYPYTKYTWRAYNRLGEPIELEVVRRVRL